MFQFIEKQKKLIQILLGLIMVTFMTWGIQSYTNMGVGGDSVATVDGLKISQREYSRALQQRQDQLRAMFGGRVDPAEFDTPQVRRALLNEMIDSRLMALEAAKNRLTVTDDTLREAILAIPAFRENGSFSQSAYKAVLRSKGMTPEIFESNYRYDLQLRQLADAVRGAAIPSRTVARRLVRLMSEQREVSQALVPVAAFLPKVKLDPGQAKAYYSAHPDEFTTPERVRVQYVVLSADELAKDVTVTEAELKAAYAAHPERYKADEQRRASHILIQVPKDAKPAVREAALKKAEKILAEVRKSPDRFAELAKKYSQDLGSASQGGDLGYFDQSGMDKDFAKAAFSLKKVGDISGVVKTQYGYDIIKLTGIQPGHVRTLDDVRKQLTAELEKKKANREYASAAENFSNMVFEQSDTLAPVAKKYKLKLQTSGWITRSPGSAPPPLNNAKLVKSLFSDDSLEHKRNTEAVEVAPQTLVSARVLEHQPQTLRKFADVKDQIEKKLRNAEALKLAAQEGKADVSKLRLGSNLGLKWDSPKLVSRRDPKGLSADALRAVVGADVSKLPAYVGADKDGAGYAIYRINKVVEPGKQTEAQRKADLQRLESTDGTADHDAFLASLRKQADIKINEKNLASQQ